MTNHGAGTVTVYARGRRRPRYGPAPVAELRRDPMPLQCPHSVSFSREGRHLAISNAGGRTVSVYRREPSGAWSESPVLELDACDPASFDVANGYDRREGGSKGVAFAAGWLGVCSPSIGLRVHRVSAEPGSVGS